MCYSGHGGQYPKFGGWPDLLNKEFSHKQGDKMRENLTADWAFGIKGAIENIVRNNFSNQIRNWPLLQAFDFEAYLLNSNYLVMILKDKLSGITAGPGIPKQFPYSEVPTIPPKLTDMELWQIYLRDKFSLKEEDAAFLIPIHDSGSNSATEDYKLFSGEEKEFWDHQIKYVVTRQHKLISPETKPDETKKNIFIGCNINGGIGSNNNVENNMYIHTEIDSSASTSKRWFEKPSGILALGVVASLIAALIWWSCSPYFENKHINHQQTSQSSDSKLLIIQSKTSTTRTSVPIQNETIAHNKSSIIGSNLKNTNSKVGKGDEIRRYIQELDKEIEQKKLEIENNPGIALISKDKNNEKSESDIRLEKELEALEVQRTNAKQKLLEILAK